MVQSEGRSLLLLYAARALLLGAFDMKSGLTTPHSTYTDATQAVAY